MKPGKILLILLLVCALGAAGFFGLRYREMQKAPDPKVTAVKYLESLCSGDDKTAATLTVDGTAPGTWGEPATAEGKALYEMILASRSYTIDGSMTTGYRRAEVDASVSCLSPEKLMAGLAEAVNGELAEMVAEAKFSSDIYNPDLTYKTDAIYTALDSVIRQRAGHIGDYTGRVPIILSLVYDGSAWRIEKNETLRKVFSAFNPDDDPDDMAAELYAVGAASPEYVRKRYTLPEKLTVAPEPDRSLFHETDDPAELTALLETPMAVQLLEGQSLVWNADIERIPGSVIRYYLDETILVIQWEELTARAIGTHTEIVTADGSQLRRKIVNDTFEAGEYVISTELAAMTNAVMALSGDFYNLYGRYNGIVVYDREIYRFEPDTIDNCFVTAAGDLIMSPAGQFATREEAEAFIRENDVIFSLCFGPILIDEYQNVTPDYYTLGEVNDTYPRCAIGQLGPRHYLTLNINVRLNTQYIFWATVKDLGEAMMKYGCQRAYTLDGGQTATTVINNQLINDVQFGEQRPTSDIIYFATAVPEK